MNSVPCSLSPVPSFGQAYDIVKQHRLQLRPVGQEPVSLTQSLDRVLAGPVLADRDFPPFPKATRDGFALRSADIKTIPATLHVIGQIKAGGNFDGSVGQGQAAEIMTGAAVPEGADAVVMVEYTRQSGDEVEVLRSLEAGENIVAQGTEASAGAEILASGTRMSAVQIALAAAVGQSVLAVYTRPKIAIVATGDELVDLSATPARHQIRNSNTYSLAAQVTAAGGEPLCLPIAPDDKTAIRQLIQKGLAADLLLLSGGVSMGKFDLVEQVLADLGAKFFFTGVQIQPGKPIVFGEVGSVPFFGLPGNPVSTLVTFDLFVQPVIQALSGGLAVRLPTAQARLAKDIRTKTGLTRFLPAVLSGELFDPQVEVVRWQGSGDISAAARANCYAVVPADREFIAAGESISVLLRRG